jgi:ATP-binding protein involved in chromosome partitioning
MKAYQDIAGDGGSNIVGQVTEQARRLKARMAPVKHIIAVMSGKGGVGKSQVTVNLASALALDGLKVGIMDADINGPSIAKMAGARGQKLQRGETGMLPATGMLGMKIMSMDLFLPEDDAPVIWNAPSQNDTFTWRGMMETAAVRELLSDTEWGKLDFLLIDLPPGTDKLPHLVDLLPQITGTVIVTIPSGVSQFVVGKSIHMAREVLKTPVIGLVENMSAYVCPHCGNEETLFPTGNVEKLAGKFDVPFLGKIPFDPRMAVAADEGKAFMRQFGDSAASEAMNRIAIKIKKIVANG